jgi:CheY-like chemotaxis protein
VPCPNPILLVEQHPDVRTVIHEALAQHGYTAIPGPSAAWAVRKLEHMEPPGLILLDDLLVEERDRLLEYVREHPALSEVPIVLLTVSERHPRGLGVRAVLRKPFALDALVDVVEAHCLH